MNAEQLEAFLISTKRDARAWREILSNWTLRAYNQKEEKTPQVGMVELI